MLRSGLLVLLGLSIGLALAAGFYRSDNETMPTTDDSESESVAEQINLADNQPALKEETGGPVNLNSVLKPSTEFQQTLEIYKLANGSDIRQLEQLISQAFNLERVDDRKGALYVLISRYTELDPYGALDLVSEPRFSFDRAPERALWRSWIESDFQGALSAASSLTSNERREWAADQFYNAVGLGNESIVKRIEEELGVKPARWVLYNHAKELSMTSPDDAVMFINSVAHVNIQVYLADKLGSLHAKMFPAQYNQIAAGINSTQGKEKYLLAANKWLARVAPEMAVSGILATQSESTDWTTFQIALRHLVGTDVEKATEYWLQIKDKEQRLKISKIIILQLAQKGIDDALVWAEQMEAVGVANIKYMVLASLSISDPRATLDLLDRYDFGEEHAKAKVAVIGALSLVDAEAALQKFRELPDSSEKNEALALLIEQLLPKDSGTALKFLTENHDILSDDQVRKISWTMGEIPSEQAATALAALQSSANPVLVKQLFSKATSGLEDNLLVQFLARYEGSPIYQSILEETAASFLRKDPETAISLAQTLSPGKGKDSILSMAAGSLARKNPLQVKKILNQISDAKSRSFATASLAREWGKSDFASASMWVKSLQESNIRENAILALLPVAKAEDAVGLISDISNKNVKKMAVASHFRRMIARDTDLARTFLEQVDISSALKEVYREVLDDCFPAGAQNLNQDRASLSTECQSLIQSHY